MPKNDLARYCVKRELGSGSFGVVFLAEDKETGEIVAMKRISKMGKFASREIDILQKLSKSKNCVHMLNCFYTTNHKNAMVQNMIFDFYPDNLENLITRAREKKTPIPPEDIKNYAYQLLVGLAEIHKINVLHRDLKPENLLLKDGQLAISDFGSSKIKKPRMKSTPYIVSRFYRAPELLLCVTEYNEKIDIWAAGCIIAEMCYREPVFQGKDDGEQLRSIIEALGPIPRSVTAKFLARGAPFQKSILAKMSQEPHKMTIQKWVSRFKEKNLAHDLLRQLLDYDPDSRISADEALKHPFFANMVERRPRSRSRSRS